MTGMYYSYTNKNQFLILHKNVLLKLAFIANSIHSFWNIHTHVEVKLSLNLSK